MHIAIIMDGNGRWAAARGLARTAGHRAGARAVDRIVEAAARAPIDVLTLYAFSANNWNRPLHEVQALFGLFRRYLLTQTQRCLEQGIRVNVIGRRDRLSPELRETIEASERMTAQCSRMHLRLAVDYSAQASLMAVCGRFKGSIDRSRFAHCLADVDHAVVPAPDVDLLIRTGGEKRLSDFLLWECAYAELYFTDCLWPDFDEAEFTRALEDYRHRDRRFGAIVEACAAEASHG
jgi:undecaprenyl diphosphate synthase